MATPDSRLFQCWYLEGRNGPYLQFTEQDGQALFVNRGVLGNTRNVQRGSINISQDTISLVGSMASTRMMDPPGFTTVLGNMPLTYRLDGSSPTPSLTLTDAAGKSAVLKSLPRIPAMAARLGKTHISDAVEGQMSDWYILRLPEQKFYPCFMRPDDADHATGSGTRLQIRGSDAYNVLCGKAATGLVEPRKGVHDELNGTAWIDFSAGEDTVAAGDRIWKASFDRVEVPPGWGAGEMDVPILSSGQEKLVLISRSFVSVIAPKYQTA